MADLDQVIQCLEKQNRYQRLIKNHRNNKLMRGYIFEMLFAYTFEQRGIVFEYEKKINPGARKCVDFYYDGFSFELVSVDLSDAIKANINEQLNASGVYSVRIETNAEDQNFDSAKQLIRLQDKILEKPTKFIKPTKTHFNIIVVDCSEVNMGAFDYEDLRNLMLGRSRYPIWQESFMGERIKGLLEEDVAKRGAKEFRENVSALICVKKLKYDLLSKANLLIAPNHLLGKGHIDAMIERLKKIIPFE